MVCFIEAHWNKYDPNCNPCQYELKDAVKRGSVTQEEYDLWRAGRLEFGIPKQQRMLVNDARIEKETIKKINEALSVLEQVEAL